MNVYMFIAKQHKPQGPRDVMRGIRLSSPSVAYRHLQKLENADLVERNAYGEYSLKKKASVSGFYWVGRNLYPRPMFYSLGFFALLLVEITVLALHWQVESYAIKIYYGIGFLITGAAGTFFLLEAVLALRKLKVKEPV